MPNNSPIHFAISQDLEEHFDELLEVETLRLCLNLNFVKCIDKRLLF